MAQFLQTLAALIELWVTVPVRWLSDFMDDADSIWDVSDPLLSGD